MNYEYAPGNMPAKPHKIKLSDYLDLQLIGIYLLPLIVVPLIPVDVIPVSANLIVFSGVAPFLIAIFGFFIFGKWFLINRFRHGGGNGNSGPKWPTCDSIIWIIFMILLSYIIYKSLLNFTNEDYSLFDKATLWSAVYGSIFGTLSYLTPVRQS